MNYHAFRSLRSPAESFPMCATCGQRPESKVHVELTTPPLEHQPLKSLSEVQSERDNAPECKCGTNDDAECDLRDVEKCIRLEREREDGGPELEADYRMGRGLPK